MSQTPVLQHETIVPIAKFLSETMLTIPDYQRPYKWNNENIISLFDDIKMHHDKPAYRLGTIVLHQSKDVDGNTVLNIVDGQQRTLTLMLTVLAISEHYKDSHTDDSKRIHKALGDLPKKAHHFADKPLFRDDFSLYNLSENYKTISHVMSRGGFTAEYIDFLLAKCEVVVFILQDESEAFQFFDSQNSRGKDLYPHDLLKAFHLREFKTDNQTLRKETVAYWESLDDDKLAKLFANHLYRIRRWSKGKSAKVFTKHDIAEFKGISLDSSDTLPPYTRSLAITHYYIDDYNQTMHRHIAGASMPYPFTIDQTILNGRRFFEMVAYYDNLINQYKAVKKNEKAFSKRSVTLFGSALNERASKIINTLDVYEKKQRNRKGDLLTRNIFDNALIYYIDKFGTQYISQAVEILFIWAYQIRLRQYGVGLDSMDKHAKNKHGMLQCISEALLPKHLVVTTISSLKKNDMSKNHLPYDVSNDKHRSDIYKLFNCLNYIDSTGESHDVK